MVNHCVIRNSMNDNFERTRPRDFILFLTSSQSAEVPPKNVKMPVCRLNEIALMLMCMLRNVDKLPLWLILLPPCNGKWYYWRCRV